MKRTTNPCQRCQKPYQAHWSSRYCGDCRVDVKLEHQRTQNKRYYEKHKATRKP